VIITDVMAAIRSRLGTISGLRVQESPAAAVVPPAAGVGLPTDYTFDETYGRGYDRLSLPVEILIGRASDRGAHKDLSAYVDGSGSKSIKAVLESGTYTAFDTLIVKSVEFSIYTLSATDYLSAMFTVDVFGKGS
jgi:hypothetical protein